MLKVILSTITPNPTLYSLKQWHFQQYFGYIMAVIFIAAGHL